MSYGAGVTQDHLSGIGNTYRDPLVFYDPDLTNGNTQATDFAFDDLTLPSQSHLPLTDVNASQHVNISINLFSFFQNQCIIFRVQLFHQMIII